MSHLRPLAALTLVIFFGGCTHSEDRRWAAMTQTSVPRNGEIPSVSVYAFTPSKMESKSTGVTDLSDRAQAAWIEALAKKTLDSAALRKAVSSSEESDAGRPVDRTRLTRTLVISVRKGVESQPGDRLMRTVITITPHRQDERTPYPFEFASYSVVATDTKTQNIAHLETTSNAKLSTTLAPAIGNFGTNSVGGEFSKSQTTSADISQTYENLGVDILPDKMIITRESERGLDVVGNTLITLTLAAPQASENTHSAYLASAAKLYDKNNSPQSEAAASIQVQPLAYFTRCDLMADVKLDYQMRRITEGREYYSEGKQTVEIVTSNSTSPPQPLVRAAEAQSPLYQVLSDDGRAVLVSLPGIDTRRLLFDSYDDAKRMASWLSISARSAVGKNGPKLTLGGTRLPPRANYRADFYSVTCPSQR